MRGSIGQDLRIGARGFLRRPGLSLAVVATLALAIGATTTVVSAVRGVLLRPLPYSDAERLAVVEVNTGGAGWYGASAPEYLDMARELAGLEDVAGFVTGQLVLGDSFAPRRIAATFATARLLPLLGAAPLLGRPFTEEEDLPDTGTAAVLSHGLWRERFGADPGVLGRTLALSGRSYVVVGVMPEGFSFPDARTEVWVPVGIDPSEPPSRANHFLTVVGRLAPGVTVDAAAAELDAFAARTRERFPDSYSARGFRTRIQGLHAWVVGPTATPLMVLLGTAGTVLLIACANVANLLLVRGETRRREMAVRTALGASRPRIVGQLLTETAILAAAGGVAGVALAVGGVRALVALAPPGTPRLDQIVLDGPMLGWAALVTGLTGLLFGLAPALRGVGSGSAGTLGAGRGTVGRGGRRGVRARRGLLATQVALATVLTVGAGLMIRTLSNLYGADVGFRPEGVLTLVMNPSATRYPEGGGRVRLYAALRERVEAIPGVEGAAVTCALPMTERCGYLSLLQEGSENTPIGEAPDGVREIVTPNFAEVMGLRMSGGRWLRESDGADDPLVAVVNVTLARRLWPGQSALGKRFRMWSEGWPLMEVVGVAADVRNVGLAERADPTFYVPLGQAEISAYSAPLAASLAVRTAGDPLGVAAAVRRAVAEVDATIALSDVRPMADVVAATVALRTFTLRVLQGFALVAVLLAGVGVYGVLSVEVGERLPEIGLRKALGARPVGLVRTVVLEGLVLAGAGALVGLAGGALAARWLDALLYEVSGVDGPTLAMSLGLLLAVAVVASAVPAWRASRVDPVQMLRSEV